MHYMQGPCIGRCYMEKMEKEREEKEKKEKEEEKKKKDDTEEGKEVESKKVESEDTSKSQLWHQQQELWSFINEMQTTHTF